MGELLALVSALCWSLSMVFARKAQRAAGLKQMTGLFVTILVNNLVVIPLLLGRLLFFGTVPLNREGIALFAVGGVLNSFVGRGFLFLAVARMGPARAGLFKATTPLFVITGGVLILGERLAPLSWLGVAVVLTGLLLVSLDAARRSQELPSGLPEATEGKVPARYLGVVVGLAAAFFLASGNLCRKAGINRISDSILGVTVSSLAALVTCVLVLLLQGKAGEMKAALRHLDRFYLLSGVCTSGALLSLYAAMTFIPISVANSLSATEPLFTMLAVRLLGEKEAEGGGGKTLFLALLMVLGTAILVLA